MKGPSAEDRWGSSNLRGSAHLYFHVNVWWKWEQCGSPACSSGYQALDPGALCLLGRDKQISRVELCGSPEIIIFSKCRLQRVLSAIRNKQGGYYNWNSKRCVLNHPGFVAKSSLREHGWMNEYAPVHGVTLDSDLSFITVRYIYSEWLNLSVDNFIFKLCYFMIAI